jgi:hypothetical protein
MNHKTDRNEYLTTSEQMMVGVGAPFGYKSNHCKE